MPKRSISSLFIIILFYSISGVSTISAQDLPGWYLLPPSDDDRYLHSVGEGETLRDATVVAYYELASKIDTKYEALSDTFSDEEDGEAEYDSVFSNQSKMVVNQNLDGIELSGIAKSFSEEKYEGNELISSSVYTRAIKMRLEQGESFYEATIYIDETEEKSGQDPFFHMESTETINGLNFGDVLTYIDEQPNMEISHETRWNETEYEYFVLLKYAVGEARMDLDKALERDEELYRQFKESKAFEKLEEDMKKMKADSTEGQN